MLMTFIQTHEFSRRWKDLGFDDDSLHELEMHILENPQLWPVMQGTGGLRKMRFARKGSGKSGGVRVCYVVFLKYEQVYLITAYAKNEQDNLTQEQRNNIRKAIAELERRAVLKNGKHL